MTRLIDADALLKALRDNLYADKMISTKDLITNAPTVEREGWVSVPIDPSDEHLTSMAKRYDHRLCIDGYYDTKPIQFGASHAQRMEGTKIQMRQLYEEAIGEGFYKIPAEPKE